MNDIKNFSSKLQELITYYETPVEKEVVEVEKVKNSSLIRAERMIEAGKFAMLLRIPYVFGGTYEKSKSFDCSAFVQTLYKFIGSTLPRTTRDQIKKGTRVKKSELLPGDLIFYDTTGKKSTVNHVAMYIGNNEMIHTNSPADGINIQNINTGRHAKWEIDYRRILPW